ncbi:MAG: wax ester/triacylglycerol synthase family O-acyltransferase [Cytophagales bacterium]|nr:wax ester/triacylglycerol synthase family O-acyltransferase [Cytophagales bacterium]
MGLKHLSSLDATFLHLESPEMPMHVGSLHVLDLPEGYAGDFFEDAKAFLQARLHLADIFTRKLGLMPFDLADPVWVEDDDMDIDYHLRHISLPKPGTNRQLQQYVARLHSSLLDRSRPLWEFFFIDGLKSGQVAFYSKVHHAGVDGQAGVALGRALFDVTPEGRQIRPPRARTKRGEYQLGIAELLSASFGNAVKQAVNIVKTAPALVKGAQAILLPPRDETGGQRRWTMPKNMQLLAPKTPLNVAITNQRSFAGKTVPLAEVKMIGKTLGVSLNDVVMGTVSGALRAFFKMNNELPARSLLAAVPVSLRAADDATANNQVSMMRLTLATDIADPLKRLQAIHAASMSSKNKMEQVKGALPTDFPMLAAPWLISGLASLFGRSRLANVLPPIANVAISNVPGIQAQLYFAGAKVVSYYPVSIPAHSMALNVTVQSYNGRLDYGLIACRKALPDINELGDLVLAEHRILLDLALKQQAELKAKEAENPAGAAVAVAAPMTAAATPKRTRSAAKKVVAKKVIKRKIAE